VIRIGTYVLERELGRGATGTVHLGRSRAGRAVAVKVLRLEQDAADPTAGDRLRAALEAARGVGGFHTAPVLDVGTEADTPWFATAYVPGPSLAELLGMRGPLGEDELHRLGTGLADALQSVHGAGLAHGDLKASDVLMADDGPRVRDYGLRPAPAADDVRALGALLVAAAGGDVSQVPAGLRETVEACLDAEPARRPDTDTLIAAFHQDAPGDVPVPPQASAPQQAPHPPAPSFGPPAGAPPAPAAPPAAPTPGPYAPPPTPVGHMPPPQGAFGPAPTAPPGTQPPGTPPTPGNQAAPPGPGAPAYGAPPVPGPAPGAAEEPEFLAMDRKNDIVADAHGLSFSAHGRSTDLAWPHIHHAQHRRDAQGSQYVLTLALTLTNGVQAICQVGTRNMWEIEQWAAQLDTVLARFLPRQ
jgi:serine/threonine protein kinase